MSFMNGFGDELVKLAKKPGTWQKVKSWFKSSPQKKMPPVVQPKTSKISKPPKGIVNRFKYLRNALQVKKNR